MNPPNANLSLHPPHRHDHGSPSTSTPDQASGRLNSSNPVSNCLMPFCRLTQGELVATSAICSMEGVSNLNFLCNIHSDASDIESQILDTTERNLYRCGQFFGVLNVLVEFTHLIGELWRAGGRDADPIPDSKAINEIITPRVLSLAASMIFLSGSSPEPKRLATSELMVSVRDFHIALQLFCCTNEPRETLETRDSRNALALAYLARGLCILIGSVYDFKQGAGDVCKGSFAGVAVQVLSGILFGLEQIYKTNARRDKSSTTNSRTTERENLISRSENISGLERGTTNRPNPSITYDVLRKCEVDEIFKNEAINEIIDDYTGPYKPWLEFAAHILKAKGDDDVDKEKALSQKSITSLKAFLSGDNVEPYISNSQKAKLENLGLLNYEQINE